MPNTFTYRHSDLPPFRPEIKAEIVALDVHIADLILKSQGNYRELEELAEVLDSDADSCELNLNSIRIIADDSSQPEAISMKDLPLEEKRIIYSCSYTNSLLLNMLANLIGKDPEDLAKDIAAQALIYQKPVGDAAVEKFVSDLVPLLGEGKDNYFFKRID